MVIGTKFKLAGIIIITIIWLYNLNWIDRLSDSRGPAHHMHTLQ